MHVLWLTARSMSDLCSTTQRNLIDGLLGTGPPCHVRERGRDDTAGARVSHPCFASNQRSPGISSQGSWKGHGHLAKGSNRQSGPNGGRG